MDWNRYEYRSSKYDQDSPKDSRTIAALLNEKGYTLAGGELARTRSLRHSFHEELKNLYES